MKIISLFLLLFCFFGTSLAAVPNKSTPKRVVNNREYTFQGVAVDYFDSRVGTYKESASFLTDGNLQIFFISQTKDSILINVDYYVKGVRDQKSYDLIVSTIADTLDRNKEKVKIFYGHSDGWPASIVIGKDYIYYYLERQWRILFDFFTNYVSPFGNSGFGSGFAINENTMITNYHVVAEADSIFATNDYQDDSSNITLSVIYEDKELDIAVLKSDKKLTSCSVDRKIYDIGEDVTVYGYPQILKQGFSLKATKGIISSRMGYQDDAKTYQIDAAVQPGNSGGPLVRKDKVIGIVVSRLEGNSQNVNYAIKSNFLGDVIDVLRIKNTGKAKPKDCTYTIMKADAEWLKNLNNK